MLDYDFGKLKLLVMLQKVLFVLYFLARDIFQMQISKRAYLIGLKQMIHIVSAHILEALTVQL